MLTISLMFLDHMRLHTCHIERLMRGGRVSVQMRGRKKRPANSARIDTAVACGRPGGSFNGYRWKPSSTKVVSSDPSRGFSSCKPEKYVCVCSFQQLAPVYTLHLSVISIPFGRGHVTHEPFHLLFCLCCPRPSSCGACL